MKKTIVGLLLLVGVFFKTYSQEYDDRLVTRHLQVDVNQDHFASYLNGFKEGLAKAKAGEFSSLEGVASQYNIEIRDYPSLKERLAGATGGTSAGVVSTAFVSELYNVIKKADQYKSLKDLRNEYIRIAVAGNLTVKDAETLALIDITTQELEKDVVSMDEAYQSHYAHQLSNEKNDVLNSIGVYCGPDPDMNVISAEKPIAKWLICGLGVVGSAIMGALSGAGTGATVGALFGAVGAASGAIVGGVLGFIGGAALGIARYCQ